MVPTQQGRVDGVDVAAGFAVGPKRRADRARPGCRAPLSSIRSPRAPPTIRVLLDTRVRVEDLTSPQPIGTGVDAGATARRTDSAASIAAPTVG